MEELKHRAYYIARHYDRLWTKEEGEAAHAFMVDGQWLRLALGRLATFVK